MKLSVSQLSEALGISPTGACRANEISLPLTDSRSLLDPTKTIFFALTTSCNDGHRYLRELYRNHVSTFVINESVMLKGDLPNDATYFVTDKPVIEALQQSAIYIRSLVDCPVIGITGSRGKTVVKELIADTFDDRMVTTSPRSWNSQIGVPLSVWRLEKDTQLAIFEAGISQPGEMNNLERMIQPTIGVFTGLTDEHSRSFITTEEKMREKASLFVNCSDIIYIDNDPVIEPVLKESCPDARLHKATGYQSITDILKHMLEYRGTGMNSTGMISTRIDICEGLEGNIFAYDHYSNDLGGIETALDQVTRRLPQGTPLTVVMGDLQLRGMDADTAYGKLGKLLIDRNVDRIVAVGHEISQHADNLPDMLIKDTAANPDDFNQKFNSYDFPHSALLIKGAPGQGFERIKTRLEDTRHDTCLEVNLDALVDNFNYYRSLVSQSTGMIGMVKADAYGAGAIEISRTLQSQGADYLAVAVVEEGLTLRRAGISMPIMVLNPISSNYTSLFDKHLEPTVFSLRELELLSNFVPSDQTTPYPIHVKLDTGMHRFGLNEDELPHFIDELSKYPQFKIATVFSHLATADCPDMDDYTEYQLTNFDRMSSYIVSRLGYRIRRHILNTAGIMRYPRYQYDLVRLGIGLYGISPIEDLQNKLRPVSRLTTAISALQTRHNGETVGYSRRGKITCDNTIIATLPIGYADGLNRHLGNGNTSMIVNGVECPTVGNICMDICMIDVTQANARCTDRVEIFGDTMPVTQVAQKLDTIPYEVLTWVAPRVKRIYYRE